MTALSYAASMEEALFGRLPATQVDFQSRPPVCSPESPREAKGCPPNLLLILPDGSTSGSSPGIEPAARQV
jgi:hypothetical protein